MREQTRMVLEESSDDEPPGSLLVDEFMRELTFAKQVDGCVRQ